MVLLEQQIYSTIAFHLHLHRLLLLLLLLFTIFAALATYFARMICLLNIFYNYYHH